MDAPLKTLETPATQQARSMQRMVSPVERDMFGDTIAAPVQPPLRNRFIVPPFSVIDCRCGEWQDRKRAWNSYGIKSAEGRDDDLMNQGRFAGNFKSHYDYGANVKCKSFGVATSVFDPALAELCYSWFAPVGARVLDPFAGGSVRGIVAAAMGMPYLGIDLRAEQVSANEAQAAALNLSPRWIVGDSTRLGALIEGKFDMVMTCPPYFDLERYSEDPADLSNMSFEAFTAAVYAVALGCSAALRMNRMACVVIQDVRDEQGLMRGIVNTFASAFRDAGMRLYNEAVILQPLGTACMRAGRFFQQSRKLCKTHGTLLVFVKGNPPKLAPDEQWRVDSGANESSSPTP